MNIGLCINELEKGKESIVKGHIPCEKAMDERYITGCGDFSKLLDEDLPKNSGLKDNMEDWEEMPEEPQQININNIGWEISKETIFEFLQESIIPESCINPCLQDAEEIMPDEEIINLDITHIPESNKGQNQKEAFCGVDDVLEALYGKDRHINTLFKSTVTGKQDIDLNNGKVELFQDNIMPIINTVRRISKQTSVKKPEMASKSSAVYLRTDNIIKSGSRAELVTVGGTGIDPAISDTETNLDGNTVLKSNDLQDSRSAPFSINKAGGHINFGSSENNDIDEIIHGKDFSHRPQQDKPPIILENAQAGLIRQEGTTETVSPGNIVLQIVNQIKSVKDGKSEEIELKLNPESLGRLIIKVSSFDNKVSISIKTQYFHTNELLNEGIKDLKDTLSESGLEVMEFSVSPGSQRFFKDGNAGKQYQYAKEMSGLRQAVKDQLIPEPISHILPNVLQKTSLNSLGVGHINILV